MTLAPFDLRGEVVHLEPMSLDHVDGLVAAATEDRATFGFTEVPADHASMTEHVTHLLGLHARGSDVPFTTCDARTGRVLGATRFLWLRSYFGSEGPEAVEIDARNAQSRAAIERLGAQLDGVMRNWQPSYVPGEEGRARDTALYSIIPSEWPAIRQRLQAAHA